MTQYLGDFGVERFTGVAEAGNKNEASAILRYGVVHQIVCPVKVVDGVLTPAENLTKGFGRGAAKVPAGSAIFDAYVIVKGPAAEGANLAVNLKNEIKDAEGKVTRTDYLGSLVKDSDVDVTAKGISTGAGTLIDTVIAEDGYVAVSTGNAAAFEDADITIIVEYV